MAEGADRLVVVRGPLPFDDPASVGSARVLTPGSVARIAEHTTLELLASFPEFDLGVALVDGALLSAVGARDVWGTARMGLVLEVSPERVFLLVSSVEIAPRPQGSAEIAADALAERLLEVVRTARTRF